MSTSPKYTWILAATILASGMAFLDGSVVNVALPALQANLHATLADIEWVIDGYVLALAALILSAGALADRFGRRRIFAFGISLFTFGSLLCTLAPSITWLIGARIFQGVGAAVMVPGSLAIINSTFPPERRGRAIGLWAGLAGGVAALGPFVGGWLIEHYSWRAIFLINLPLGILALLITFAAIVQNNPDQRVRHDWLGTGYVVVALTGLALGLIKGPALGWLQPLILVSLAIGVIGSLLFIIHERRVRSALIPLELFTSRNVVGANLYTLLLYFSLNSVIFLLILNLQQVQNYSPVSAGLALMPAIGLITFLSGSGGTLADRIGVRRPMIIGPLLVSAGLFWLGRAAAPVHYAIDILPGLILFGLGMALVIAPLTKTALMVAETQSGVASGLNNAVARIAALFAIAIAGALMLGLFRADLTQQLQHSVMTHADQQSILTQVDRLGGIDIPTGLGATDHATAISLVHHAFLHAFQMNMLLAGLLALGASVIAGLWIREEADGATHTT